MTLSRLTSFCFAFTILSALPVFSQTQDEMDLVSRITKKPQTKASTLSFLAALAEGKGERRKAVDSYNKLLAIYKSDPGIGDKSPKVAWVISKIGVVEMKFERKEEACTKCKEALRMVEGLTPGNSPGDGNYLLMIKQNCTPILGEDMPAPGPAKPLVARLKCIPSSDIPDLAEEEKLVKEHLAKEGKKEKNPIVHARTLLYLANIYTLEKKYKDAEPLFKKSISIIEKHSNRTSPKLIDPLSNYGYMLQQAGKQAEADAVLARLSKLIEQK